jgi:hypothetical protein
MSRRRPPQPRRPRQIAPRLVSGESRVGIGHGLPPHIKAGIQLIAARERKSLSWVLENVIIEYFGLRRPKYRRRPWVPEVPDHD